MKKRIASLFILFLLLIGMWGSSAWFYGSQVEKSIKAYDEHRNQGTDHFLNVNILSYSRSIFGGKATIQVELNDSNRFINALDDISAGTSVKLGIEFIHGPVFIRSSGISFGRVSWKVKLNDVRDPLINNDDISENDNVQLETFYARSILKEIDQSIFIVDFENILHYKIPITSLNTTTFIKGRYDLNTKVSDGTLQTKQISYDHNNTQVLISGINAGFRYAENSAEKSTENRVGKTAEKNTDKKVQKYLNLKAIIPQVILKSAKFNEKINFSLNYQSRTTLDKHNVSSAHDLTFEKTADSADNVNNRSHYPFKTVDTTIIINKLNVVQFIKLTNALSKIINLQQQLQWVLADQSELPDGQDKLLQLESDILRHYKQLPALFEDTLKNKKPANNNDFDSVFKASLYAKYKNHTSKAVGRLQLPKDNTHSSDVKLFTETSFLALLQSHTVYKSDVVLDAVLYPFFAERFPINKNKFKLLYTNNKILMQ